MEITRHSGDGFLELEVTGRLDSRSSEQLSQEVAECVRTGAHHLRLDLAGVGYISSAGISVLVGSYKQLKAIRGTFAVTSPSQQVLSVIRLSGLDGLLLAEGAPPSPVAGVEAPERSTLSDGLRLDVFPLLAGGALRCTVIGDPDAVAGDEPREVTATPVKFPADVLAVGLGAFGDDETECRDRFGELVAAGGAAVCAPTDESGAPDYLLSAGPLVAGALLLSGVVCTGEPSALLRFERTGDGPGGGLSALVSAALELSGGDALGLVMVAETEGLVGAALKRSPALRQPSEAFFAHPQVRRWLSFTPERVFARSLALVAGIATRRERADLGRELRPLGGGAGVLGHFHAAALPFRPLPQGRIGLAETVAGLFESGPPLGVLHLLNDDRPIVGGGESAFLRGALWIGPLAEGAEVRR
jgi:anti-anti-sigma factor